MIVYVHPLFKSNDFIDRTFVTEKNKPLKLGSVERVMNSVVPFLLASKLPGSETNDLWLSAVNFCKDQGDGGIYITNKLISQYLPLYDLFVMYSPDDTQAKEELQLEIENKEAVATADIRVASLLANLKSQGLDNRVRLVAFDEGLSQVFIKSDDLGPIGHYELSAEYSVPQRLSSIATEKEDLIPSKTDVILGKRPDLVAVNTVAKGAEGTGLLVSE